MNKYKNIGKLTKRVLGVFMNKMFPDFFDFEGSDDCFTELLEKVCDGSFDPARTERELLEKLPEIRDVIMTDVQAAYEGDPAAKSTDEIIITYPCFKAISIYRIAHELYLMQIPVLPRLMTEYGHRLTGIDIHPGATIGKYFFIDHGTGVVIGETTVIGEHVKLYQHVTLGAKSFDVNDDGTLVKGIKRHPNIGNNVVIYAGATILGGDTFIGDDCVIGGNVWLTSSLNPGETVYYELQKNASIGLKTRPITETFLVEGDGSFI